MNSSRKQRKLSGFPMGAAVIASNDEKITQLNEKESNMGNGDNVADIKSLGDVPVDDKSSEKLSQKENRVRISSRRKNGNPATDKDTSGKKRTSPVVGRKGTSPVIGGRKVLRLSNGKKLDTDVVRRKIKRISVTKNVLVTKNIVKKPIAVPTEKSKINKNASVPSPMNGSVSSTGFFYPGCHLSTAGGLHNAVISAVNLGCKSMALFLRPQRTWAAPPLDPEVQGYIFWNMVIFSPFSFKRAFLP